MNFNQASNGVRTFVCLPTRNDEWIIERVLKAADLFADHIIVADENSTDKTQEICKKFSKVKLISFEPKGFNESNRRRVLLDVVRQWDGQNLVFGLDSDEILTSEILNPNIFTKLLSQLKPGMSAKMQWIMLWKNPHDYRYDNTPEWSNNFKEFVYWDDRKIQFEDKKMHTPRAPEAATKNFITFKDVKVLHYNFAEWKRVLAKHIYYLALEKTMGSNKHPYLLNRRYRWFYAQPKQGIEIKKVPEEWVKNYEKNGLDMLAPIKPEDLYWYETEVLKFFKEYGPDFFKHLNIWQTNWQEKLTLAKNRGETQFYQDIIKNPQPWYDTLFYSYLQTFLDKGSLLDKLFGK